MFPVERKFGGKRRELHEKKSMCVCVCVLHHHQTHEYRNSSTNGKQMATKRSSTRRAEVMLIHIHTHAHRAPVTVPSACSGEQYSRTFCQDAIQRLFFRTQNRLNTEHGNHRILKDVAAARRHFSTPFFYFIFTRLLPLLRSVWALPATSFVCRLSVSWHFRGSMVIRWRRCTRCTLLAPHCARGGGKRAQGEKAIQEMPLERWPACRAQAPGGGGGGGTPWVSITGECHVLGSII